MKTESVSLDGLVVGKHVGRTKFAKALPLGNAITELVLGYDMGGTPYLGWWDAWRAEALGDIHQQPDLATLVVAPDRANTANVLCDFVHADGAPVPSCPRGVLRHVLAELAGRGFAARAAFEIEAMLFTDALTAARRRHFADLTPMGTNIPVGYLHHSSRQQLVFVDETLARLDALGIAVEGWHDEAAPGQFEINLDPTDPLAACDAVVRAKQVMREVALEHGHLVTFMAKPSAEYGNGLHVHHSLTRDGEPVFYAPDGAMSSTMQHWIGGLMASSDALTSFACPTINSYRRMVGFAAAPTVASWGEDNKSAAIRVLSVAPGAARIEYRVAGGDANPYLVLAGVLAAGIAGLDAATPLPPPIAVSGWGLPPQGWPHLPTSITRAADALEADAGIAAVMGAEFVPYWVNTRRWEWLMFHTTGGDPTATTVTPWELDRYFELA
ncbi:MAG: glutamine synthetase family protein [Acidimicrobiia bacterium]